MTYNIIDDAASLASNSLHGTDDTYEDLHESSDLIDAKRAAFGARATKDISLDLHDLLQEMEEERDDSRSTRCDSSASSQSASLALDIEDDDESGSLNDIGGEKIGSKLQLDEFPSESKGLDWGSLNWGSFMGSFRKRVGMNSSRRLLRRKSSKKIKTGDDSESDKTSKRKKVRFMKFETIIPSHESFSRRNRRNHSI